MLEGIHRQKACLTLGIPPKFTPYQGNDPLGFVISANMVRRHLTTGQRAMIADKLATMRQGERTDLTPSAPVPKVSRKTAAAALNVSERSVTNAAVVRKHGTSKLVEAVEAGVIPLKTAAALNAMVIKGNIKKPDGSIYRNTYEDWLGWPDPSNRALARLHSV